MSKGATISEMRKEINRLNSEIDLKIIKGEKYGQEARRHKALLSQLSRLTGGRSGWLSRGLGFLTLF